MRQSVLLRIVTPFFRKSKYNLAADTEMFCQSVVISFYHRFLPFIIFFKIKLVDMSTCFTFAAWNLIKAYILRKTSGNTWASISPSISTTYRTYLCEKSIVSWDRRGCPFRLNSSRFCFWFVMRQMSLFLSKILPIFYKRTNRPFSVLFAH